MDMGIPIHIWISRLDAQGIAAPVIHQLATALNLIFQISFHTHHLKREKGERRRKGLGSVTQMIPAPGEGARMGLDMTR